MRPASPGKEEARRQQGVSLLFFPEGTRGSRQRKQGPSGEESAGLTGSPLLCPGQSSSHGIPPRAAGEGASSPSWEHACLHVYL